LASKLKLRDFELLLMQLNSFVKTLNLHTSLPIYFPLLFLFSVREAIGGTGGPRVLRQWVST